MSPFLRTLILFPAFAVFVGLWRSILLALGSPLAPQFIKNPDAFVRLERIRQLMETGQWFDQVFARVGSIDHVVLHWTRPLDILIVPIVWTLQNWFSFSEALILSGIVASLAFGLLGLAFAAQLPTLFEERHPVVLGTGALFMALSPHYFFIFAPPSWPDHHGLMIVLFCGALLAGHRMLAEGDRRWGWVLGMCQALAVWISPESLLAVATLHMGFGFIWVLDAVPNTARLMRQVCLSFLLGLLLALGIEYGPTPPGFELDRLSWFSIAIAACLTLMWVSFGLLQSRFSKPLARLALSSGGAVICCAVLLALNPHALGGPMGEADAWFVHTWTGFFSDGFWLAPRGALLTYVAALVCAISWARREQNNGRTPWVVLYVLPSFVVFAALSLSHSSRWVPYAELIAMPMIVVMFADMARKIMAHSKSVVRISLSLSAAIGFLLLANVYILMDTLFPKEKTAKRDMASKQCELAPLIARLNTLAAEQGPQTVLGYANITPTILLHTPHRVQAIPIHPDAQAVHQSVNVFVTSAQNPSNIDADVIVMCTVGHERVAFGERDEALYSRLMRGDAVQGFTEIMPVRKPGELHYQIFLLSPAVQTHRKNRSGT